MESFDSLSDCSESSRNSISLSTSTVSIASGFSEYQNEFLQLKDVTASGVSNAGFPDHRRHVLSYDTQLQNMKTQLKKLSEENSKLKSELVKTENNKEQQKSAEINKLLLANNYLEASLEAANKQIQRLLDGQAIKHVSNINNQKILILENDALSLRSENRVLEKKLRDSFNDNIRLENDFNNIKTEIAELKLEYNANTNCIVQLKAKIAEQHVKLEEKQSENGKLTNLLEAKLRELETTQKMENWYKQQLHQIQKERSVLSEKNTKNRESLFVAESSLETLKLEVQEWKYKFDKLQLDKLREKEILLKGMETRTHKPQPDERIVTSYQTLVNNLNIDIDKMKRHYENQQSTIAELNKQKLAANEEFLRLGNALQEKQQKIDNLQDYCKNLDKNFQAALNNQEEVQKNLKKSEENALQLTRQIDCLNNDKSLLESTIKGFKDQFVIFKQNYHALNDKLQEKSKEVADLKFRVEECSKNLTSEKEISNKKDEQLNILKQTLEKKNIEILDLEREQNCLKQKIDVLKITESIISEKQNNFYELAKLLDLKEFVTVDKHNVDFLVISYLNVIQLLQYFLKIFKVDCFTEDYNQFDIKHKTQYIQTLFTKMATTLHRIVEENLSNVEAVTSFKNKMKKIMKNIDNLNNRCKELQEKCEHSEKLLEILNEKYSQDYGKEEEIKHVRALLVVKAREQSQQQKRFEKNYHVLLRKVKEHMRGKSVAEKQTTYYQGLYQNLLAECNTLKTELNSKEVKVKSIQTLLQTHVNIEDQLKSSISVLNNELDLRKTKEDDNEKAYLEEMTLKSTNIEALKAEIVELKGQLLCLNTSQLEKETNLALLSERNNGLANKINNLESNLIQEKYTNEKLKINVTEQNEEKLELESKCEELSNICEDLKEKNEHYLSELEASKLRIEQQSEEIMELQRRKTGIEYRQEENNNNLQNLITALRSQLLQLQNDLMTATREKHFLQRLCNDLKVALQIHVNHNKVVKEYVSNMFMKKEENDKSLSFSVANFTTPLISDDEYIDKLVEENNSSCQIALSDIQGCLSDLRNEILMIQKDFFDKNRT